MRLKISPGARRLRSWGDRQQASAVDRARESGDGGSEVDDEGWESKRAAALDEVGRAKRMLLDAVGEDEDGRRQAVAVYESAIMAAAPFMSDHGAPYPDSDPDLSMSPRRLVGLGAYMIGEVDAGVEDATEQLEDISECLGGGVGPRLTVAFLQRWARSGFPIVSLGHKLAASMMATSVAAEVIAECALPWETFLVEVPDRLLGDIDTRHVGITINGDKIAMLVFEGNTSRAEGFEFEKSKLCELRDEQASKERRRAIRLLGRLIASVVVELQASPQRASIGHGKSESKRRESPEPKAWTVQLMRPVEVDCREWVREYIRGGGSSPTVQSLVRGYTRHQPCGPRWRDRRLQYIAPAWRGNADAPIAVRDHKIKR